MSSKGCTELQISLSRAKNVEEAAGDIHFCVFPQKTSENAENPIFWQNFLNFSESVRTHPNASRCIRMHRNATECIRTGPNKSEQAWKLQKTWKNLRKLPNFAKIFYWGCVLTNFNWRLQNEHGQMVPWFMPKLRGPTPLKKKKLREPTPSVEHPTKVHT